MNKQLMPNSDFPEIELTLLDGSLYKIGKQQASWELFIVYRGKHCPRCKTYLNKLESLKPALEKLNIKVIVASADSQQLAQADVDEFKWQFPMAYGLSVEQMKTLNLWVSARGDGHLYAEPGLFLLNDQQKIQILSMSNGPACRPDLDVLLDGVNGIKTRGLPVSGTVDING